MLSGECRIEAISHDGNAALLDGLRLRLDLRLRSTPAAASTRARAPTLSPDVQRLAAVAGLSSLLVALAFWSWGGPSESVPVPPAAAEPAAALATPPAPEPATAAPAIVLPAPTEPSPASSGLTSPLPPTPIVAPSIRPLDSVAGPRERKTPAPRSGSSSASTPASTPGARLQSAEAAPPAPPRSRPAAPAGPASPSANRDLLDLFGDTK